MKSALRTAKNFAKGYSDIQIVLRDATSNEPAGPTTGQLQQIAAASEHASLFADIIYIIDKRLNDSGRNWRHVYKTLLVLEYGVCCGSEAFVAAAQDRLAAIRTLREFVSISARGLDRGSCVREKSRELYALLTDAARLAEARRLRQLPVRTGGSHAHSLLSPPPDAPPTRQQHPPPRTHSRRSSFEHLQDCDEDAAMRRALADSAAEYERLSRRPDPQPQLQPPPQISLMDTSVPLAPIAERTSTHISQQLLELDDAGFSSALESLQLAAPPPRDIFDDANRVADEPPAADPFADALEHHLPAAAKVQPIAMPAPPTGEVSVGAKPVMPASFAPQFGNSKHMAGAAAGGDVLAHDLGAVAPQAEADSGATAAADPFADALL